MLFPKVIFIIRNKIKIIFLFFLKGLVHDDLRTFLDTNLPKEKKRAKMILGVADSRIASAINELFTITCQHTGVVPELLRGKMNEKKNTSIVCFSRSATSFSKFSQRFN